MFRWGVGVIGEKKEVGFMGGLGVRNKMKERDSQQRGPLSNTFNKVLKKIEG